MRSLFLRSIVLLSTLALAAACGNDEYIPPGDDAEPDANTVEPDAPATAPTVTATATPTTLAAGDTTTLTITVTNFTLEAPAGQPNAVGVGHYHVYLDAETGPNYLVADSTPTVVVMIPNATTAGPHTLKVQLFENDHTALVPEVFDVIDITVQ